MKNFTHSIFWLSLLALLLLLAACENSQNEGPSLATVSAIQSQLKAKKDTLRMLAQEVEMLEDSLIRLDPSFAPKLPLVSFEKLSAQAFESYTSVLATVLAAEIAMVTSEIPGQILRMGAKEGDVVQKGQLIAVLNVESTETQKAELKTAMELARTVYERQKRLWEQNIGSELQYLEAKNAYERLEKQLENIEIAARKANVYAPISGTVDRVMMRSGENAMPGAPIISIISTGDLNIVADAPEGLLTKVKKGDRLKVNIPTLELSFSAPVKRIGRTIDPANRTFEVEIAVPAQYRAQLKTNLLAEVEILDFSSKELLVLSQNYIQQEVNGQRYVFTVQDQDDQTLAVKSYITTGRTYNNKAIIEEGLQAGDRIITQGGRGLTNGQAIAISETPQ